MENSTGKTREEIFTPKGPEPEWKMIYDALRRIDVGGKLTYAVIEQVLGRPVATSRNAVYRAIAELEQQDQRTASCVRGEGYVIVSAGQHLRLAKGHTRKASRQLGKAKRKVDSADRSQMSSDDRRQLEAYGLHLAEVADVVGSLANRMTKAEKAVAAVGKAVQDSRRQSSSDVAALGDRVDAIERLLELSREAGRRVDGDVIPL